MDSAVEHRFFFKLILAVHTEITDPLKLKTIPFLRFFQGRLHHGATDNFQGIGIQVTAVVLPLGNISAILNRKPTVIQSDFRIEGVFRGKEGVFGSGQGQG